MAREGCQRNRVTRDAEHDERVMTLAEHVLGRPAEEQEGYLRDACGSDTNLFHETLEYVRQEEQMGTFLHDSLGLFWDWDQEFEPGQLLAERFEIRSVVGEGGMAWVYEATDRTTRERVAIKCPKPEFRGRLLPETVISRKVTHDNVGRVHEIHRAITAYGELEFLTMEFLEGETLEERLDREKRLSLNDTREIARQLCSGLAAAHSQDIVHGDLKPNNIMLSKNARGETRVVITDFGLARPSPTSDPSPLSTMLFGAPDYVAPELLHGVPRSVASDIFALGVILYEALAGERPTSEIRPLRGVPRRANQVIRRCLNPEPAVRPQTVREVLAELEGQWSNVRRAWAAAVTVVLCLAAGLWVGPRIFPTPPLSTIRLAVLPSKTDAASKPLVDGVIEDLSGRLSRVQRDGRGMTVILPREASRKVENAKVARSALGATHTLQTDFHQANGKLSAHAVVRDTQTEQVVRSFSAEYALSEVGLLPKALLQSVTSGLGLKGISVPETVQPAAYADYVQGVHYLNDDEHLVDRAIPFFERAAGLDMASALPYAGMSAAEALMFETSGDRQWLGRAEESLKQAVARNPDALEVYLAAGLLKRSEGQPERALDDFRHAVQLEPGNPDALRRLAEAYAKVGLTAQALETYQQAISARPEDYHAHMNLGVFYYSRGQYTEAETQFRLVTEMAPGLAQGHLNLGGAYTTLGRYPEAETEMRNALDLREDRDTWLALGAVLAYEKRVPQSVAAYERAVALGTVKPLALSNLADAYRRSGRSSEARQTYKKALQVVDLELTEGDPGSGSGPARAFAGYLLARLGDGTGAEREIRQALRLSPDHADVLWRAVLTFEVLGKRAATLEVLKQTPQSVIENLSRQPDLAFLQADPRFIQLRSKPR